MVYRDDDQAGGILAGRRWGCAVSITNLEPGEYWPDASMDSTSDERRAIISDLCIYWLEWLNLAAAGLGPDRWQRYSTQRPPHIQQEPRDAGAVRRNWAALGVTQ